MSWKCHQRNKGNVSFAPHWTSLSTVIVCSSRIMSETRAENVSPISTITTARKHTWSSTSCELSLKRCLTGIFSSNGCWLLKMFYYQVLGILLTGKWNANFIFINLLCRRVAPYFLVVNVRKNSLDIGSCLWITNKSGLERLI